MSQQQLQDGVFIRNLRQPVLKLENLNNKGMIANPITLKNFFKILQDSRWKYTYTQYLSTYCSLRVNEKLKIFLLVCGKH